MRWLFACSLATLASACGSASLPPAGNAAASDVAGADADASAAADIGEDAATAKVVKLDFLWVIDHSASMCGHQFDLAGGFKDFVGQLQAAGQIDAQMAVVTVQQIPDKPTDTSGNIPKIGQFVHKPEVKFPPSCIERLKMPCTTDGQCVGKATFTFTPETICSQSSLCTNWNGALPASEQGLTQTFTNALSAATSNCPPNDPSCNWRCQMPNVSGLVNDNCSFNSYCWRHCTSDAECRATFEPDNPNARMICTHPGGTPSKDSGCQYPPATADCPPAADIPPVLGTKKSTIAGKEWNELDLFHCSATVRTAQSQESKFEGGLRSAWLALDPNGPNCPKDATGAPTAACQNKQLLRDDAYLVIVVVSDDDDCSVNLQIPLENADVSKKNALDAILSLEVRESCQGFGDRLATNRWLNEGNCEFLKGKKASGVTFCPCDCRAMAAGSTQRADCEAQVLKDTPKFAKSDFRFATPGDLAWRFKSLKKNPNQVMFAAVTGLSGAGLPGKAAADGDATAFYKAQLKKAPGHVPYICAGARGVAGFGSRYTQVAEAFGARGLVLNICKGEDFGGQLQQIGSEIVKQAVSGTLLPCADQDGDGFPAASCGGSDCDDNNAMVFPATQEVCGNGLDDDCDGATDSVPKWVQGPGGISTDLGDGCKPKP